MDPRLLQALVPLVEAFAELGIDYQLGGSVASSIHGVPRSSLDIDILAGLRVEHVAGLIDRIKDAYYIPGTKAFDAIERESSFNVIHLETMFKVDIFVAQANEFRRASLERRTPEALTDQRTFFVTTAEDIVLHKLHWYREGGEVSNQQWQDVLGVLKVQGPKLDMAYLRSWARKLHVADLLERALGEATGD